MAVRASCIEAVEHLRYHPDLLWALEVTIPSLKAEFKTTDIALDVEHDDRDGLYVIVSTKLPATIAREALDRIEQRSDHHPNLRVFIDFVKEPSDP